MRRTSIAKHYQIIDLKVSLHHQFHEFYSTMYSRFKREKYLGLTSRGWVWGALLYIKNSSNPHSHPPKAKLGSHYLGNMKQGAIFGVTEPTLDAASVALHQLRNVTVPIMTGWLPGLSLSVNTDLSAQRHRVRNKTNTKLSTLGSVSP